MKAVILLAIFLEVWFIIFIEMLARAPELPWHD